MIPGNGERFAACGGKVALQRKGVMAADAVKITVVVPTHNTAGLVVRNIESLAGQTMPASDFEVIYVDDGSTDRTADVIAHGITGLPNFSLIRSTNSGWPGRPRNIGIDAAQGEFVFFADDDDWLEPDALRLLYARAVADNADIVIGRIAGHGRGSHSAVTRASLTDGNIRNPAHSVLLKSMTVHKLYRRSFLDANSLRFDEGKVRLEDHIFALRAYLRTNRVSILHDRTVYHWVRSSTKAGNHSFGALDPDGYTASVDRIFTIINDEISEPKTRRRFMLNWYTRKVLGHPSSTHFLNGSKTYADALVQANRRLMDKWSMADYDDALPHVLRVRAALFRLGDAELLRAWGRYEQGVTMRTEVRSAQWRDDTFVVRFSIGLVSAGGDPLMFARRDGRVIRVLPEPYAGISELADAADVTPELARRAGVMIRNRKPTGDVFQAPTSTLVETPSGGDKFTVGFDVEVAIDPMTADHGRPISGTWDLYAQSDLCGHLITRRISAESNAGIASRPHLITARQRVAEPILTTFGNLSLRVSPARNGAARWWVTAPLVWKARSGLRPARMVAGRALTHAAPVVRPARPLLRGGRRLLGRARTSLRTAAGLLSRRTRLPARRSRSATSVTRTARPD